GWRSATGPSGAATCRRSWLEVPLTLAIFHRRLADLVVAPGGSPLGDPGGGDLVDHLLDRVGPRAHGRRARGVADRAIADLLDEWGLCAAYRQKLVDGVEH